MIKMQFKNSSQQSFKNEVIRYIGRDRLHEESVILTGDYYVTDALTEGGNNYTIYYKIRGINLLPELCIETGTRVNIINDIDDMPESGSAGTIAELYGYYGPQEDSDDTEPTSSIASLYMRKDIDVPVYKSFEECNQERDPYSSNEEFETRMKELFE